MAGTLLSVRTNIREILRDLNPDLPALMDRRMKPLIERRMHALALQIALGKSWSLAAVTTVAGTSDYTISSVQVRQIERLRRASDNFILRKRTTDWIANSRMYQGTASGSAPTDYALAETATQTVTVMLWPTPQSVDTIDRFGGVLPTNLTTDATAVPFSEAMLGALEFDVAALCILSMSDEQRGKMGIGDGYAQTLQGQAQQVVKLENSRRMETQRQSTLTLHSR